MLDGNTRDDGTPCGFGGCLYTRPSDRDDSFTNTALRLGAEWRVDPQVTLYGLAANASRPPQATKLYRLQSEQRVANLKSEDATSYEIGGRGRVEPFGTALDYST